MNILSQNANYLLLAMNNGMTLIEHGYSLDEYDADIWFDLDGKDYEDSSAVQELIDAGLIRTEMPFANPMARKYEVTHE